MPTCSDDKLSAPGVRQVDVYIHVIKRHRNRYTDLLERCKKAEDGYRRYAEKLIALDKTTPASFNVRMNLDELPDDYIASEKCVYEELVEEENKAKTLQINAPNPKIAQQIVGRIRKRSVRMKQQTQLQSQMKTFILDEMFQSLVEKEVRNAESSITQDVLKQSAFEKKVSFEQIEALEDKLSNLKVQRTKELDIKRQRDDKLMHQIFFEAGDAGQYEDHFKREEFLNLHKKIYAEKLRMKAKRVQDMCSHALKDMVDYTLSVEEYLEQHGEEMGRDEKAELTELFLTEQPIFKVINGPPPAEELKPEDVIQLDIDVDRQNFEAYCNFKWPWELDRKLLDEIQLAANILGHIVFRCLLKKYPKPLPPTPPPDLPTFDIAVCVENLTDAHVLEYLDKLLAEKKIKVILMENAKDFCVKAYEWETTMEYPEAQPEATIGSKGKSKDKKQPELTTPPFLEKQLQTPKIYPCEIIQLTPKAELGESTTENQQPNDELLTKMFIEYIKSFKDTQGWVLINYPRNFAQAALLEEALTGRPVLPTMGSTDSTSAMSSRSKQSLNECEYCECLYKTDETTETDKNAQYRTSKLLTDPNPPPTLDEYKSYLTAFIHISQSDEISPRFPDEVNDNLQAFYLNQGNLYTLYYKTFDFTTVKYLAKLIIGDYSIPPKTSVQIFGDTVVQMETEVTKKSTPTEKRRQGRSESKEKKNVKKQKKNKEKIFNKKLRVPEGAEIVITREDKETQIPEIQSEMEFACSEEEEAKPGGAHWKYVDIELPDFFEVALATFWENVEEIYVSDFKDLLFNERMLRQAYVSYANYVKQQMTKFIARSDDKQTYLRQFQNIFNEFDEDMRNDCEVKAKLLCQVYQFREKLWDMCDERLKLNEEETKLIAEEDWLTRQTCELTNAYIAQLQVELDRCIDTLMLLNEYYVTMMNKAPAQESLEKVILNYIHFSEDEYEYGGYLVYSDFFKQLLFIEKNFLLNPSPFHRILNKNFDVCIASVRSYQTKSLCLLRNTGKCLQSKRACKNKMKLEGNEKGHFEKKLPIFSEPPRDVKEVGSRLLEEWRCAVQGEVARAKLRFDLLKSHAHLDLQSVISYSRETFDEIKRDVTNKYKNEICSIQDMYNVITKAITKATSLQSEIILDGPNILLFKDTPPPTNPMINECRFALSIYQLTDLVDVFMKIAPTGMVSARTFTYVLQDFIVQKKLPHPWLQLTTKNVCQLFEKLFGKSEVVDWKDFIVYNMCVEFPSEKQLMNTREQLRKFDEGSRELIHTQEYDNVKFWFENDSIESDQAKTLLHNMYKLDDDTVNYTALLLIFCKDETTVVGLAKALQLVLGKYVCWEEEVGEAYKNTIRRKKELEEEPFRSKLDGLETVENANATMDMLIDKVVHQCDSTFLEEIKSNITEDKNEKPDLLEEEKYESSEEEKLDSDEEEISESFTNVEIGFEADSNPPKVYYLPFEALCAVFRGAMPWCMAAENEVGIPFREKLEIAYKSHKDPEHNGMVLAHELLNSANFLDLLKDSFKFVVRKPSVIIEELITNIT